MNFIVKDRDRAFTEFQHQVMYMSMLNRLTAPVQKHKPTKGSRRELTAYERSVIKQRCTETAEELLANASKYLVERLRKQLDKALSKPFLIREDYDLTSCIISQMSEESVPAAVDIERIYTKAKEAL